ncbi:MAG: TerB family tellurite resistance protein [Labilithrix sp.]|nr:TerB family tellurite resistance protein [Labilithrix sp.]
MVTAALSPNDRNQVLRFAASFLWADLEVADAERRFLTELARELDVADGARAVAGLLASPPAPDDVDPTSVPPAVADVVRQAALRAIAADGRVDHAEMTMFELLDDLLPRSSPLA